MTAETETPSLGEILKTAREAAGWSLSRMGRATGYSKAYLWKLEAGDKEVKAWHIRVYDQALGGDAVQRRALMVIGAGLVSTMLWSELDLPTAPPERLGPGDVVALAESTDQLTGLGLRHGGRAAVAAVHGQLRYAVSLLDLSMSDGVRVGLLATVARLADRTAWSMADIGQLGQANKIYDFALDVTPDATQRWLTLVNLASLRLKQGEPQRALDLLDRDEPDLPVLRFLVHSTKAHALARLGALGPTLRHIELADAAHGQVDLGDLPEPIRPYASGHSAHVHSAAGEAPHALAMNGSKAAVPLAVERLEEALTAFGAERAHALSRCSRMLAALSGDR